MKKSNSINSLTRQLKQMIGLAMSEEECRTFVETCFEEAKENQGSIASEYSQAPPVTEYKSSERAEREKLESFGDLSVLPEVEAVIADFYQDMDSDNPESSSMNLHKAELKSLISRIRNRITGKTTATLPVIQIHAIVSLMYAENNLPKYDLMKRIFKNHSEIVSIEMQKLFKVLDYSIYKTLEAVTEERRSSIIQFIMLDYKGISVEYIQKHYL